MIASNAAALPYARMRARTTAATSRPIASLAAKSRQGRFGRLRDPGGKSKPYPILPIPSSIVLGCRHQFRRSTEPTEKALP